MYNSEREPSRPPETQPAPQLLQGRTREPAINSTKPSGLRGAETETSQAGLQSRVKLGFALRASVVGQHGKPQLPGMPTNMARAEECWRLWLGSIWNATPPPAFLPNSTTPQAYSGSTTEQAEFHPPWLRLRCSPLFILLSFSSGSNKVLQRSESLSDTGVIVWYLALCLLLSWLIVAVSLFKGIKSSGKVIAGEPRGPRKADYRLSCRTLISPAVALEYGGI